MLTENDVARSWRGLFNGSDVTGDMLVKAESMLEELRAESPLRHRLSVELDELRKRCEAKAAP